MIGTVPRRYGRRDDAGRVRGLRGPCRWMWATVVVDASDHSRAGPYGGRPAGVGRRRRATPDEFEIRPAAGSACPSTSPFACVLEPKTLKNRLHLDFLSPADRDAAVATPPRPRRQCAPTSAKVTSRGSSSPIRKATSSACCSTRDMAVDDVNARGSALSSGITCSATVAEHLVARRQRRQEDDLAEPGPRRARRAGGRGPGRCRPCTTARSAPSSRTRSSSGTTQQLCPWWMRWCSTSASTSSSRAT